MPRASKSPKVIVVETVPGTSPTVIETVEPNTVVVEEVVKESPRIRWKFLVLAIIAACLTVSIVAIAVAGIVQSHRSVTRYEAHIDSLHAVLREGFHDPTISTDHPPAPMSWGYIVLIVLLLVAITVGAIWLAFQFAKY